MKLIDLHWNTNKGEGCVKYTKAFEKEDWIVQLDMLQDCIFDLTEKYNEIFDKPDERKTND